MPEIIIWHLDADANETPPKITPDDMHRQYAMMSIRDKLRKVNPCPHI
jgi:hypothetical protein